MEGSAAEIYRERLRAQRPVLHKDCHFQITRTRTQTSVRECKRGRFCPLQETAALSPSGDSSTEETEALQETEAQDRSQGESAFFRASCTCQSHRTPAASHCTALCTRTTLLRRAAGPAVSRLHAQCARDVRPRSDKTPGQAAARSGLRGAGIT